MAKYLCNTASKIQNYCINCKHIYFIRLNSFPENFCSLDCKTTYYYIETVINTRINTVISTDEHKETSNEIIKNEIIQDDKIDDFINFSNSSFASDLNKKTLKYYYIKSMNDMYNKSYNHTNTQLSL